MSGTLRLALDKTLGFFNRVRLGFPRYYFEGTGGIGDDLMGTAVYRELRSRNTGRIAVATQHPSLFHNNPDVNHTVAHPHARFRRWLRTGLPFVRLGYAEYDATSDRDRPPAEHILAKMCRVAGITGQVKLRPYMFLEPKEMARGRLAESQIVIQSSGRAAVHFMRNKEWYPERFQEVCAELSARHSVVQIGSKQDPALPGSIDLRGKTNLRESAAILANSRVFVGLVGFLMHLARAVDCRSVIIFGGRERPWQTGYIANVNLVGDTSCSPCWQRNRCDFGHECMHMITSELVLSAAQRQIQEFGRELKVETTDIQQR